MGLQDFTVTPILEILQTAAHLRVDLLRLHFQIQEHHLISKICSLTTTTSSPQLTQHYSAMVALTKHWQPSLRKNKPNALLVGPAGTGKTKLLRKSLVASQSAMTLYQTHQLTVLSARFHFPPSQQVHLLSVSLKREWLTSSTMLRTRKITSFSSSMRFTSS